MRVGAVELRLADVEAVALERAAVPALDPEARARMERARSVVEGALAEGRVVYGVTTGFGRLADVVVPPPQARALQENLLRSHAVGVGAPLERAEVRAMLLLRAHVLARGYSGVRPVVVERLLDFLRLGIHPVVPEQGSVGASGDLAPLAHLALPLLGEGEVERGGRRWSAAEALASVGLAPLVLEAKEALALINGTQAMTAVGVLALRAAERALETAELAGALSLDALRGSPDAFDPRLHALRPHPGQVASAARLWALLQGSAIRESHRHNDPRVQDAYALRCMPQVHGAARQALAYVHRVLAVEANAVTDNPLVFPEDGAVLSGGNFHGQIVAQALDLLAIAAADLASIAERRIERLLNPEASGFPAFLAPEPGLHSGLMMLQVTAAALVSEMKTLAHPASVDSIPTGAGREDHVSMGMAAALKARRAVRNLEAVLAIELLCAAQALEFLRPLRSSPMLEAAYDRVRRMVAPLRADRYLQPELDALIADVRAGAFAALVDEALGPAPAVDPFRGGTP